MVLCEWLKWGVGKGATVEIFNDPWVDDRVLEGFIHNIEKPVIPDIHGHLLIVGFLHVSHV
ncbi:hypothetical protein J1N35_000600 [Gossypium stocksii]|uniref:Uncharacterized protein n=1 Tax=Gossypium stocksii TaxID=47602 RepID=A0A9D3WG16_9ROSI|nr:hypothetical protein J1N35_000600 [Gossypium stocksii]